MLQEYLKAGFPALLVRTHEPDRFIGAMLKEANGRTPFQFGGAKRRRKSSRPWGLRPPAMRRLTATPIADRGG